MPTIPEIRRAAFGRISRHFLFCKKLAPCHYIMRPARTEDSEKNNRKKNTVIENDNRIFHIDRTALLSRSLGSACAFACLSLRAASLFLAFARIAALCTLLGAGARFASARIASTFRNYFGSLDAFSSGSSLLGRISAACCKQCNNCQQRKYLFHD